MKKTKLLSLIGLSTIGTIAPIVALTSCGSKTTPSGGVTMEELQQELAKLRNDCGQDADGKIATSKAQLQDQWFPVGHVIIERGLANVEDVKAKYGGNEWQPVTGAIYGVGGAGTTQIGAVSQSVPYQEFTGTPHDHTASVDTGGQWKVTLNKNANWELGINSYDPSNTSTTNNMKLEWTTASGADGYSDSATGKKVRSIEHTGHDHTASVATSTATGTVKSYTTPDFQEGTEVEESPYIRSEGEAFYAWVRVS